MQLNLWKPVLAVMAALLAWGLLQVCRPKVNAVQNLFEMRGLD